MKISLTVLLTLCSALIGIAAEVTRTDSEGQTNWLYSPTEAPVPGKTYQLVVGVHGAGGNGRGACGVANWATELEDVIVLGPSFTQPRRDPDAPRPTTFPRDIFQMSGPTHEAKLRELLESIGKSWKLHPKIFLHGFSAGAQFTHRFAFKNPDLVAAVSAHSGGSWAKPEGEDRINPAAKNIPFAVSCGEDDHGRGGPEGTPGRIDSAKLFTENLRSLGFNVNLKTWPGVGHTQTPEAIAMGRELLQKTCSVLIATEPAPNKPPSRPAPLVSPEVNAGAVTFRLKAPGAKEVSVMLQDLEAPLPLKRGDDGIWSGTAADVKPGIWEYNFNVDGMQMLDPANPSIKPMRLPTTSILHIPDSPPRIWDFQNVPHGTVHQHDYLSKPLKRNRQILVYTPPGYEKGNSTIYPLLVLQHGSGDNQQTWVAHGKAHWILDNLIAAGKARPMVVVMLDGHPLGSYQDPATRGNAMEAFRNELFEDALPLVENTYRVARDPDQRGIVGLSMGGGQSLTVGLGNLNRFSWLGSFSGVPPDDAVAKAVFADVAGANAKLRLLWIGCGEEDFLRARNEKMIDGFKDKGLKHEWHLTAGGHSWPVWRGYLVEFLPLVFQPKK